MTKARSIGLLALAASLSIAGCWVFGGKAADEPAYCVVEQDGAIEIREYDGFAVAETTASWRGDLLQHLVREAALGAHPRLPCVVA